MYCKKCGTELAEDAEFCTNCGVNIERKIIEQNINNSQQEMHQR